MGMHHGIVATDASATRLIESLGRHTGEFVVTGDAARIDQLDLDNDDAGFALAIGESDGRAYLHDASLVLSGEPDLLVAVSRDLGSTVAGAGAETTSGSYWFVAARDGELTRFHWNSYWGQDAPYDVGEAHKSEALDPLDDLDGVGLRAALRELGFEADVLQSIPLTPYRWTFARQPTKGPHGADLKAFLDTHGYPDGGKLPTPQVIPRTGGGFDLGPPESRLPRGESGHTPRPQVRRAEPEGLARRLGRLFGRD
jgi:hypothetical protein